MRGVGWIRLIAILATAWAAVLPGYQIRPWAALPALMLAIGAAALRPAASAPRPAMPPLPGDQRPESPRVRHGPRWITLAAAVGCTVWLAVLASFAWRGLLGTDHVPDGGDRAIALMLLAAALSVATAGAVGMRRETA